MTTRDPERENRSDARTGRDPHFDEQGYTAEDEDGVGHGEEGFVAEEYPGRNPLRGESERERRHRKAVTWTWPQVELDLLEEEQTGERADQRICREIARRILRAETRPANLVATVLDGEVVIDGEVDALEDKHVIDGVTADVEGVTRLENGLVVRAGAGGESDAGRDR